MSVLKPEGDRLAILTNGVGVLAVDELLPEAWSHANPVDIHNVALANVMQTHLAYYLMSAKRMQF
ncbi:hypothetical protein QEN58_08265 [Halomonas alkaliantarctica]|uniref:Uncharacterized protein n=1 Tax=Halomonas alkaliantarctica TaxID=232346 RepID=A0ABY8LRI4_9GAMM|nr:hypothetical protein [Halomonas alkaliantarctica]WGI27043.1 hypothetical protein QEN58_08265 [Halomonas alkaliantarctica]